jgi:hypothetical protein
LAAVCCRTRRKTKKKHWKKELEFLQKEQELKNKEAELEIELQKKLLMNATGF